MLTLNLAENGVATGRFTGDLAFMRIRSQRRALYGWEPAESDIECAEISTSQCRGSDLDRMLNPNKGTFAVGARLARCCLVVGWNKHGTLHHSLELDDGATKSWAQLDANLNDPAHSPCGNSGRASYGTRPRPPTTGGTNRANRGSIGSASRAVTGGSGCGLMSPTTWSVY